MRGLFTQFSSQQITIFGIITVQGLELWVSNRTVVYPSVRQPAQLSTNVATSETVTNRHNRWQVATRWLIKMEMLRQEGSVLMMLLLMWTMDNTQWVFRYFLPLYTRFLGIGISVKTESCVFSVWDVLRNSRNSVWLNWSNFIYDADFLRFTYQTISSADQLYNDKLSRRSWEVSEHRADASHRTT